MRFFASSPDVPRLLRSASWTPAPILAFVSGPSTGNILMLLSLTMTMAIAHREGDSVVLDVLREHRPPFSPEAVCAEYASLIRNYRCSQTFGDRPAGDWVVEGFRKHQVNYEQCEHTRTDP